MLTSRERYPRPLDSGRRRGGSAPGRPPSSESPSSHLSTARSERGPITAPSRRPQLAPSIRLRGASLRTRTQRFGGRRPVYTRQPASSRQSSVVSRQSSYVSRQKSVVSRQSSVVSRVSCKSSVVSRRSSVVSRHSSLVTRQLSVVSRPSSTVNRHTSVVSRQSSQL